MEKKKSLRFQCGLARAASLTPERRKEISEKANRIRWTREKELPIIICKGELKIEDVIIPCAVLSNGVRLITETGFSNALGSRSGHSREIKKQGEIIGGPALPIFVNAKQLSPYISYELSDGLSNPLKVKDKTKTVYGFDAKLLVDVCNVWMNAMEGKSLLKIQYGRAWKAAMLLKSFAKVGLVALIDEVTGYQQMRERDELNRLLEKYLSEERLVWSKVFPDKFFKEIFRLRGWSWPPKSNKPQYIGVIINNIIYSKLPKGVLEELKRKNPPNESGNRIYRHHQFLSTDVGQPDLHNHLREVIAILRCSETWEEFEKLFNRSFSDSGIVDI